jgi:hypothetical protein
MRQESISGPSPSKNAPSRISGGGGAPPGTRLTAGTNIPLAVRHLVEQYQRFLRTSYRFLDGLRRQFEEHLAGLDVVVKGP